MLSLIPQQNKEELSRYVIRREMVTEVLGFILGGDLNVQSFKLGKGKRRDKEGLIHNLIFKRKSKNTYESNDLWILNEEYVHYDACSEIPINQITDNEGNKILRDISDEDVVRFGLSLDMRPDIYINPKEGKCIIVELKSIDSDLTKDIPQVNKYCNLIANYSRKKIDSFYCYLIGENLNESFLPGEFEKTVNGDYFKPKTNVRSFKNRDNTIAYMQMEIIKLSSIYERAKRRNKSFSSHLGLGG